MPATLSSLYTSDVFGGLWNGLFTAPSETAPPPPAALSHQHHQHQQHHPQHPISHRVPPPPAISHASRAEPTFAQPQVPLTVPSQQQQQQQQPLQAPTGTRPGQTFYADLIWGVGNRSGGGNPAEMARQVSGQSQSQYSDGSAYSSGGSSMSPRQVYTPPTSPTQLELDHYSELSHDHPLFYFYF